jgi:outer membrane protein assembly factor BamE (lipoprotein component of BamABCDE complex)
MAKDNHMKKIILILCCVILSACTFQTKHRGYVFPSDLETDVATVKTTAQLMDKIGAPQAKTLYGDEVWIYYGADENYRGPLPHTFTDKTVLLAWVNGNAVKKIRVLHDDDLEYVKMASGETEIPAAIELNALEELFNNIGRFTPAGLGQ